MGVDTNIIIAYGFLASNKPMVFNKIVKDNYPDMSHIGDYIELIFDDITFHCDGYSSDNDVFVAITSTIDKLFYQKTGGHGGFGCAYSSTPMATPTPTQLEHLNKIKEMFLKYGVKYSDSDTYVYYYMN